MNTDSVSVTVAWFCASLPRAKNGQTSVNVVGSAVVLGSAVVDDVHNHLVVVVVTRHRVLEVVVSKSVDVVEVMLVVVVFVDVDVDNVDVVDF